MADHAPIENEAETLVLARQRIMARFQCTEEEAAERLRRSIQELFNGPDIPDQLPVPQQELPPEPPAPLPEHPIIEDTVETTKKKPSYVDFDINAPIASRIPHSPSEYAVGKVENIEYVELWYFTTEGCREAGKATPSVADDTFGILKTNTGIALQPLKATKASKNAIVDEHLSWEQIMTARHTFINVANHVGWNQKLTLALAQFYINLEGLKSEGYNPRALILYQAVVRKRWHDALKGRGDPFNISIINDELYAKLENQIRDRDLEDLQRQALEAQKQAVELQRQVSTPISQCPRSQRRNSPTPPSLSSFFNPPFLGYATQRYIPPPLPKCRFPPPVQRPISASP